MKNVLFLTLMILCSIQVYGQESQVIIPIPLSKYDKLIGRINSDSSLIQTLNAEIEKLKAEVKDFEKEKAIDSKDLNKKDEEISNLKNEKEKLEQSNLKKELDKRNKDLEVQNKELSANKKIIQDKEIELTEIKAAHAKELVEKKEEGKQVIISELITFYDKPFDELQEITSKSSIQRDLVLLGSNPQVLEKLKNLQVYHESRLALAKKYDEGRVLELIKQLNALEQTSATKKSIELLSGYNLNFVGLQETLANLISLNSKAFGAGSDFIRNEKFADILDQLTIYFYDYEFTFDEYPYLTSIISEIIQKKQGDIDADLSYLKEKF